MRTEERDELLIRIDERVKTVFNRMEKFETLFTNHLASPSDVGKRYQDITSNEMVSWVLAYIAAGGAGAIGMM